MSKASLRWALWRRRAAATLECPARRTKLMTRFRTEPEGRPQCAPESGPRRRYPVPSGGGSRCPSAHGKGSTIAWGSGPITATCFLDPLRTPDQPVDVLIPAADASQSSGHSQGGTALPGQELAAAPAWEVATTTRPFRGTWPNTSLTAANSSPLPGAATCAAAPAPGCAGIWRPFPIALVPGGCD